MSNIDWSRPLEAYHEDGRCAPATVVRECAGDYLVHCDAMPDDGDWYFDKGDIHDFQGWRIRNKAEHKADIPDWAKERACDVLSESLNHAVGNDIVEALARYIMTKEEPPVDPVILAVRNILSAWENGDWHEQQAIGKGGYDKNPNFMACVRAFQKEIERGEVK